MKIVVYAICKNEAKNIKGFLEMAQEADAIVMLDTGSEDGTPDIIEAIAAKMGIDVRVEKADIQPFDFSIARNMALQLARETGCDYGISIDLDERTPQGWAETLRNVYELNKDKQPHVFATTMQLLDSAGNVVTTYHQHKTVNLISLPSVWAYAAHEVLIHPDFDPVIVDSGVVFTHYKDSSKPRNYIDLLANDFAKYPNDHRSIFYYGRELYYAGRYEEAVEVLRVADANCKGYFVSQHLELLRTLFYSSRDVSYLFEALALNPKSPFLYYEMALYHYKENNPYASVGFCELIINSRTEDNLYPNDVLFPDPTVLTWKLYDVMSNAYWEAGDIDRAYQAILVALEYNPTDPRLVENCALIYKATTQDESDANTTDDLGVGDTAQKADVGTGLVEETQQESAAGLSVEASEVVSG